MNLMPMQTYKLAQIAPKRRKGTSVQLPVIAGTLAAEKAYLKALRFVLRELAREVRTKILPPTMVAIQAGRMTRDADPVLFDELTRIAIRLGVTAEAMVWRILGLEADRHTAKFTETAKRALGIDLVAIVRKEDLSDYLATSATRSAGLIKGLATDAVNRVQRTVTNAVINGWSGKDLKSELTRQFGFSDSRAKLIARDQVATFNSDLNRIRHQQAGVTTYIWRTAADERVRERHAALEGKSYKYGEATGAEDGLAPGQPIQCRCIAQAIVEF